MTKPESKVVEPRRALRPTQAAPVRRSAAVTSALAAEGVEAAGAGVVYWVPFAGDDAE